MIIELCTHILIIRRKKMLLLRFSGIMDVVYLFGLGFFALFNVGPLELDKVLSLPFSICT